MKENSGTWANTIQGSTRSSSKKRWKSIYKVSTPLPPRSWELNYPENGNDRTWKNTMGLQNPEAHIKAYMTQENLLSGRMVVHCRLFPTTLMGVALEWYYSLPRNSIDSFNTLCAWFFATFADCKPIVATSTSLHNVLQGEEEEGLRQYMTWFAKETLNILELHLVVAMHVLLIGLRSGKFLDTLYMDSPTNMDKLRSQVAWYINIEENVDARRKMMKTSVVSTSEQYPKRKQTKRLENYTPLNTSWDVILCGACNLGLVQLSPPTTSHPSAPSTKKCNYHQNMGHTME